jgi:flavin reductase (DIM6/NTAB) family NADH-FMN oxidoreductase RutF
VDTEGKGDVMCSIEIDFKSIYYPSPIVIVGATVGDRPNYLTAASFTKANHAPPMIAVSLGTGHFTFEGIESNRVFSVSIPDASSVVETDYCGIVSGAEVDKSTVFTPFYGQLKAAPMIREAIVGMACAVEEIVYLPEAALVIGKVVEIRAGEKFVTSERIDPRKAAPFCYVSPEKQYFGIGRPLGAAKSIGRERISE